MASTQSGKSRGSLRKAPPTTMAEAPKVTSPRTRKTTIRKTDGPVLGSSEWQRMVATAAYFRAEARGFAGGSPEQDWLEAEAELLTSLSPLPVK